MSLRLRAPDSEFDPCFLPGPLQSVMLVTFTDEKTTEQVTEIGIARFVVKAESTKYSSKSIPNSFGNLPSENLSKTFFFSFAT